MKTMINVGQRYAMKNKIIKTEKEYNQSSEHIYKLTHNSDKSVDPNSPEDVFTSSHRAVAFYDTKTTRLEQATSCAAIQ